MHRATENVIIVPKRLAFPHSNLACIIADKASRRREIFQSTGKLDYEKN